MKRISSKEKIKNAFIKLIEIKSLSDITVVELIELAQVGKSTFYRHYHDVYEIFDELSNEFIRRSLAIFIDVYLEKNNPFNEEEKKITAEAAMKKLKLPEHSKAVVDYLIRTKDVRLFQKLISDFCSIVKRMAKFRKNDANEFAFLTKFFATGILFGAISDYFKDEKVDPFYIDFALNLDISAFCEVLKDE